jgi:hypothetical protein
MIASFTKLRWFRKKSNSPIFLDTRLRGNDNNTINIR